MLTLTASSIRTPKQLTNVVRQPRPATSQPRPSFLTVLLRTLSAFAV
jgi:hypothetical protein